MAIVYVLYSETLKRYYTGSCQDLTIRLAEHKEKKYQNSFTSHANDWELFLAVYGLYYLQARKMESHIKKMKSRVYIENLKKYPEMLEKLKGKYS